MGSAPNPKGPRIVPVGVQHHLRLGEVAAGGDSRTLMCCLSPQLDPQAVQTKNWHMDVIEMNGVSRAKAPSLGWDCWFLPKGSCQLGSGLWGYVTQRWYLP